MNLFIIGSTFDVLGKILIGLAVLFVHGHILKEHKINKDVLKQMKHEKLLVILGIISILIGYVFHINSV